MCDNEKIGREASFAFLRSKAHQATEFARSAKSDNRRYPSEFHFIYAPIQEYAIKAFGYSTLNPPLPMRGILTGVHTKRDGHVYLDWLFDGVTFPGLLVQ